MNDPVDQVRRLPAQRWVAARYDGAHALLVRIVHPLCFAAFTLVVGAVTAGIAYGALRIFDSDGVSALFVIALTGFATIAAAFKFVATPSSALVGIASLGALAAALFVREDVPTWLLWTLLGVGCVSVVIQLVLLVRVVPNRWHNGLMHLLWPATLGTFLGLLPLWLVARELVDGTVAQAQEFAAYAFLGGCLVLVVLLVMHLFSNRRDDAVLAEFAARHGWSAGPADTSPTLVDRLTPRFGNRSRWWTGTAGERRASVVTGYTSSWAPDLPSLHITVLGIEMHGAGRDVWVRRNQWAYDNVLASLGRSEVVKFESIRLSEDYAVRFPAGTGEMTAFLTFGPELVDLLGRGLGDAQVCRIGDVLVLFVVGGVLGAGELDRMLETGGQVADLLERADVTTATA